jgi:ribonuclease Z
MQRINQIDQNASTFDKLFLTHLHSDHTTGIPDLWITGYLRHRYENPMRIWGPRGTEEMIQHIEKAFAVDVKLRKQVHKHYGFNPSDEGIKMVVTEMDEGYTFEDNGIRVIPFRVNHYDLYSDEPSFGFRIEFEDRRVILSGDTCFCENLIKFSEDVDLLVHEVCAAPLGVEVSDRLKAPIKHHTSPEECGRVFSAVNPKMAVFYHIIQFEGVSLNEMMERTRSEYDGKVVFGEDLMQIEVGEIVKITKR